MSIDEEIIYCLVHEIVDDVFKDPGEITTTSCTDSAAGCGVRQGTKGFEVHEGDPGAALDTADFMPSAAQVSGMSSGPSINKRRRRLGVNSGAHDQIMLLRFVNFEMRNSSQNPKEHWASEEGPGFGALRSAQ